MKDSINEIAAALAKAQAEMTNPGFDSQNPHFRSKFASLAAVRNAVIPVLAKHGIACVQDITTDGGTISCATYLMHSSGQWLALGPLVMPATKGDAQGLGSAATYARRYSLMSVAGVVGDDDDDGNAAVKGNGKGERVVVTTPMGPQVAYTDAKAIAATMQAMADLSAQRVANDDGTPSSPDYIPAGSHKGALWAEASRKYLDGVIAKKSSPPEMVEGAKREIDRRTKIFQAGGIDESDKIPMEEMPLP